MIIPSSDYEYVETTNGEVLLFHWVGDQWFVTDEDGNDLYPAVPKGIVKNATEHEFRMMADQTLKHFSNIKIESAMIKDVDKLIEKVILSGSASLALTEQEGENEWTEDQKRNEWNLLINKYTPSKWSYYLKNPSGVGSGMNGYSSQKSAISGAKLDKVDLNGAKKIWVVVSIWNTGTGEYDITKSYWMPAPESKVVKAEEPKDNTWNPLNQF